MRFNVISSIEIFSETVSLVVPGIDVTIALSYPDNRFNKDDLPTFGLPAITVLTPFFRNFVLL